MIDTETNIPRTPSAVADAAVKAPAAESAGLSWARRAADHLSETWANVLTATDAQVNIWSMKIVRIAILAALGLPMLLAAVALLVYGFVLLDRAFDFALQWPNFPHWFSPLIRGAIYFGVPMIALAIVMYTSVGGSSPSTTEKKSESHHA